MDLEKHLIELSKAPGVSGYESAVRETIRAAWEGLADEFEVDGLGTLLATLHGSGEPPRHRALVTAHMDEIGLMVTRVEGAFLRVTHVGGIDRRVLLSQPVVVYGEKALPGLIGSRPPHVLPASERSAYPAMDDLVVDTGLDEETLKSLVPIGTPVSFAQEPVKLGGDLISGKALDNRASVAALTQFLREMESRTHSWDVLAAATVQEEVTLGGGQTIAWRARPDIAIVVDVTFGTGGGVSEDDGFKLGEGPSIVIGPNAHPKLFDMLREKAERLDISLHPEPAPRHSGTEGWPIQVSRDGVPTAIIGIPLRNMHTPVEIISLKDIRRVARLIAAFVSDLDGTTLDRLALDAD
jgi:putative aminopeptidase FrvX